MAVFGRRLMADARPAEVFGGRGAVVVVAGHRTGEDRLGLPVVEVDDVGNHHGDVVGSAAAQREFDETVGTFVDVLDLQRFEDRLLADRIGQTVGAQQVAVAGPRLAHDQGRLDLVPGQRPHDQRALRMAVRLFGGDAPLVDQGLDEGVVLGDLRQLTVAQQIAARVADMDESKPIAREQDCGQRGAHALEFGLGVHVRGDGGVALVHRVVELAQQIAAGLVVVEVGQRGDHQLGGDLAGRVPAHPVGQRQQPGPGVHRVLVVGADQATITAGRITQD